MNHFSDVSLKFPHSGTQIGSLDFAFLSLLYCFAESFRLHISFTISITLGYSLLSCMLLLFHV